MQYDAIGRLQKYSEPAFNISVSLVLQILTIALYTDIFPATHYCRRLSRSKRAVSESL